MPEPAGLTGRQEKSLASVRDGLERDTGKNLALQPRGRAAWSERLLSSLILGAPEAVTEKVDCFIEDS
jgi:hypothetical protein